MRCDCRLSALSIVLSLALASSPAGAQERPNVLLLMADQHRADGMGWIDPSYRTPNLDRLASGGLRFMNCYTVSPLCSPSRAALMTGRYSHQVGTVSNEDPLPRSEVTVAEVFRDSGYQTAFFGKWHLGDSFRNHGFDSGRASILRRDQETLAPDAIEFLRTRDVSKPFFLMVSWVWPHPPRVLVEKYAALFPLAGVPIPSSFADRLEDKPLWYRTRIPRLEDRHAARVAGRQYRTMVRQVDAWIGRLLRALGDLGLDQNTVVAYTSDHGELLGAHRLASKLAAFDESLRVPLLLRLPPALASLPARSEIGDLVSNYSLPRTLLELAGLPVPASFVGGSLVPAITRTLPPENETVFFEFSFPPWDVSYRGMRTRTEKFVLQKGYIDELYDLVLDPLEMINRINDPSYAARRDELAARVRAWWRDTGGTTP